MDQSASPTVRANKESKCAESVVLQRKREELESSKDRLDSDEIIKSTLPDEMIRVFMHYKKDEWEKFLSAVTQWDVDTYLDILP